MPLVRSRNDKVIAGVCGGIARWLGWDANLVRFLYVLVSILSAAFPDPGLRDPLDPHAAGVADQSSVS